MQLTRHFSLAELTATSHPYDNVPSVEIVARLQLLALALEQIRAAWGGLPVRVSSGYRSLLVNRAADGTSTSSHLSGWAADIFPPSSIAQLDAAAVLYELQERGEIRFDQVLIYPGAQLHVSIDPRARGEFGLRNAAGRFPPWRPL